ncbi:MAG: hypothetical protein F4014_01645 [Gemmatimonadetes bacterium]|nr:hypothetical protein [Gemmatimonadota bacterium]MYK97542.1 hypothetical protein [Gemmatimonadota bacterium]
MPAGRTVRIVTPMPPPSWALLELNLIKQQEEAVEAFYNQYFDERGYLLCVPRWGGDDGPDDAAENFANWPELYAIGASERVYDLYKKAWDGHLLQYSEAKTTEVEFARDGMYFKEFPTMFDWMHNGEGFTAFFLEGLCDPRDKKFVDRTRRFCGFYMGDDPIADNWIPEHRVIKSMFNGSRGPMLRKATGLDWAGDSIEVEGRFRLGHGERNYEEMVAHFKDYNDVAGDHPLNMGVTTMTLNAYMIDGNERYYDWTKDYIDAWVERTERNNGIIPSNIGLDGTIGGECGGRWYGGAYGWGFSTIVPQTGEIAHRPYFLIRAHWSFGNGLLLTGDQKYVDTWRGVIDGVNANSKVEDGRTLYPRMHGDEGWYDFRPEPFDVGAEQVYYWSMDRSDLDRLPMEGWIAFLEGQNPDYPEEALQEDVSTVRSKMERMRNDLSSPDTRLSDDMNGTNPAAVDALIQLMLGGMPTGHLGHPLHCRFRYFDPARQRPGMPEDVGALVEELHDDSAVVTLVNTNQVSSRTVTVQGGAYGEHQILEVDGGSGTTTVGGASFTVTLEPGCGSRLRVAMDRYANRPSFEFPWER